MRIRFFGAFFGLVLAVLGQVAYAQKVVVLEFDGDKKGKLRNQIESALRKNRKLQVVPIKKYKEAAARKRLKGPRAMTPSGVATLSKTLKLDIAVEGAVAETFFVRLLDPAGKEMWQKDLKLKKGVLSSDNLRRLTKVIVTAATSAPAPKEEVREEEPPPKEEEKPEPEPEPESEPERERPSRVEEPPRRETPPVAAPLPEVDLGATPALSAEERERKARDEMAEAHTSVQPDVTNIRDEDLDNETRPKKPRIGPQIINLIPSFVTTWRSYCSRPGVKSCAAYVPPSGSAGSSEETVDFSSLVPYGGIGFNVELFPFAPFDNLAEGIGLAAAYSRGFSSTNVRIQSDTGQTPDKTVTSQDEVIEASGMLRYYFSYGNRLVGYAGLRGGIFIHNFSVDPDSNVPLPSSRRFAPSVGLDASLPIIKYFRVDLSGLFLINPRPGDAERVAYGETVSSSGWVAEGGFSGDIWGPFGYRVRVRYARFGDNFSGAGDKWAQGGAAEESYTNIFFGVSAFF